MEKKNEIRRKAIHLLVVIIPVLYFFLTREQMLGLTGFLLLVAMVVEGLRVLNPKFRSDWRGLSAPQRFPVHIAFSKIHSGLCASHSCDF